MTTRREGTPTERRGSPRRRLPGLLLVGALALGQAAPGPALGAEDAEGNGALTSEIRKILDARPLDTSSASIQVLDAETGESLYAHRPEEMLKPASNMKLLTAAASLALLRPEYRFRTWFYASARPDDKGVIRGDLYLKGADPPASSERSGGR